MSSCYISDSMRFNGVKAAVRTRRWLSALFSAGLHTPLGCHKVGYARRVEYSLINGLLYRKERLWIPHDDLLKTDLLIRLRDTVTAGHPERLRTYDLLRRNTIGQACELSSTNSSTPVQYLSGLRFLRAYVMGLFSHLAFRNVLG
ncbi:hypothetical protein V1505DRAFT_354121 [Lipomyces doorenjongii]